MKIINHRIDGKSFEQSKNQGVYTKGKINDIEIFPTQIVIHYTADTFRSSYNWLMGKYGNDNSSAHIIIDRDGSITQLVAFNRCAWHAGSMEHNLKSIGIELVNWGELIKKGGKYYNWRNNEVNVDVHEENGYWEKYADEQMDAVRKLCETLTTTYGITSIVGHSKVKESKKDPGPAFDWDRFWTLRPFD